MFSTMESLNILNPVRVLVPPLLSGPTCNSQLLINNSYKRAPCKHMIDDTELLNRLFSLSLAWLPHIRMLSCYCVYLSSIFSSFAVVQDTCVLQSGLCALLETSKLVVYKWAAINLINEHYNASRWSTRATNVNYLSFTINVNSADAAEEVKALWHQIRLPLL